MTGFEPRNGFLNFLQKATRSGLHSPLTSTEEAQIQYALASLRTHEELSQYFSGKQKDCWVPSSFSKWSLAKISPTVLQAPSPADQRRALMTYGIQDLMGADEKLWKHFERSRLGAACIEAGRIHQTGYLGLLRFTAQIVGAHYGTLQDNERAIEALNLPLQSTDVNNQKANIHFLVSALNFILREQFQNFRSDDWLREELRSHAERAARDDFRTADHLLPHSEYLKKESLLRDYYADIVSDGGFAKRSGIREEALRQWNISEEKNRKLKEEAEEKTRREREQYLATQINFYHHLKSASHIRMSDGVLVIAKNFADSRDFFQNFLSHSQNFQIADQVTEKVLEILATDPIIFCDDGSISVQASFSSLGIEAKKSLAFYMIIMNIGILDLNEDYYTLILRQCTACLLSEDINLLIDVHRFRKIFERSDKSAFERKICREYSLRYVSERMGVTYKSPTATLRDAKEIIGSTMPLETMPEGAFKNFCDYLYERADIQNRWSAQVVTNPPGVASNECLILGDIEESGENYLFCGSESLITIARPGQGKSQAHVIRNLLYLDAPAIVLDVKPEIFDSTSTWRSRNVGPVYRFQPSAPKESLRFNPLGTVRSEPTEAYADVSRLVPLLMVPRERSEAKSFWESRSAQLLTAAIFDVCVNTTFQPSKKRDMAAVVDWFSVSERQLVETITRLKTSEIRVLARVGNQLDGMDPETQANLFETVLSHIQIWGSPQIEHLISETTIDIGNFRDQKGTIYICVTETELVSYRGLIRSLLGSILFFLREDKPRWKGSPVTFFLDEFPQLGYMEEVEQMVALGRQAGLRLWFFAQSLGQISQSYGDADRLLDMMAAKCFIAPTGSLAELVSRELGTTRDIFGDRDRQLASPQELAGPQYSDKVIVLAGGRKPIRLRRVLAVNDPIASSRGVFK